MAEHVKVKALRSSNAADNSPEVMKTSVRSLRVLLIQPPALQGVQSLLPQVDREGGEGIGFKPPLGLLYVATLLQESSIHEIYVIDAIAERLTFDEVAARALDINPDVVGISAWTDFWYPAYETGRLIKEAMPDCHLVYGGPHLGIYPQETLEVPFVDSVIVGDGEIPFLYLCNLVANGVVDNSLPGLHFKSQGVKPAPYTFFIHGDLDSLPSPNRTLLPIGNYGSVMSGGKIVTTMITSRGCPFRCTFCKLNFQKTICRSSADVVSEFRQIAALGINEVEIYDDTFTWSSTRLVEICEGLIEADLGVTWAVRDRVSSSTIKSGHLALMRQAGCNRIHFGVESGVQRIIDRMKKNITLDQAHSAVKQAKEAGMTVLTYFMFGNLDETIEDMRETINFALTLDADVAQFSITIPYAGTEMYLEALKQGIITTDYWQEYARHPIPWFDAPKLIENHADRQALIAMRDEAIRKFYFRPRYLWRELRKLTSYSEFTRKMQMGLKLFRVVYAR